MHSITLHGIKGLKVIDNLINLIEMSEELVNREERELLDIRTYLFDLLDELNALEENRKDILTSKGINNMLLITLELITLNKYNLDLIIKYYWDNLEKLINSLNTIEEIKSDLTSINEDFEKLKEARERLKFR